MRFTAYAPYLTLFIALTLLPVAVGDLFIFGYIRPRCELIIRTAYKGKMLQKLKRLRYEHMENENSMKIIDMVYKRDDGAEESASNMFPRYIRNIIQATITTAGTLYIIGSVKWWLLFTVLAPFILDTIVTRKFYYDIFSEMEQFWNKDRQYGILGNMLKSREFIRENILFGASRYLVETYRKRLSGRNREYEKYVFRWTKQKLAGRIVINVAQLGNALLLFYLYINGGVSIGMMISLTLVLFSSLFGGGGLSGFTGFVGACVWHLKTYDYYDKYFSLSEDEYGGDEELPDDCSIEFNDVHFTYPGAGQKILNGLTFTIKHGEKVSVVGKNGEGKTTMIKLLLGLFRPDSGEIRIGGKPLDAYSQAARRRLFGPVFQDFVKYSVTLAENVGVGDIDKLNDKQAVSAAMCKAGVDVIADNLVDGTATILGRDFEGGVDLSGGQWQRIAIARAFMGDKPILILDELASQLDPMAESRVYSEFAEMTDNKTAILISHRLGSTMITDKIFVIEGGRVAQSGSHDELMERGGLYADMFNAQKQWYVKDAL